MWCFSERGGRQGDLEQQRQPAGSPEEATESADRLLWPSARPAGAQFWASEVSECAGQDGAGSLSQPDRHAGQNLVPEQEVSMWSAGNKCLSPSNIEWGGGGLFWNPCHFISSFLPCWHSFIITVVLKEKVLGCIGLSYYFPLIYKSPARQ